MLLLIILGSFLVWKQVLAFPFLHYDDQDYVVKNLLLQKTDLRALFSSHAGFDMYIPLTWISYAVDWHLGRGAPFVFHLTNLLLHLVNGLLVYLVFSRLCKQPLWAILAAGFFLVHPMRAESVAWVAQRKDLLYFFWYAASFYCYLLYCRKPQWYWYLGSFVLFVCACLSKPMAVSLPILLLLMNVYWYKVTWKQSILKYWPFLLISLMVSAFALQQMGLHNRYDLLNNYNAFDSIVMVCYSLGFYCVKAIVPLGLSIVYTYPVKTGGMLPWPYLCCAILVPVALYMAWRCRKTQPVLWMLMLMYLVVLLPVLQLVPNTFSPVADRYFYASGIIVMSILFQVVRRWLSRMDFLVGVAVTLLLVFAWGTYQRAHVFKDTITVFTDAIDKGYGCEAAYSNRGLAYNEQQNYTAALPDLEKACRLNPANDKNLNNYGWALVMTGHVPAAIDAFRSAIAIQDSDYHYYSNLGGAYGMAGNYTEAEHCFTKALELNDRDPALWKNLGITYQQLHQPAKAEACFRRMNGL